jgi:hypothetical protein
VGLAVAVLLAGLLVVTLGPAVIVLFGRAAWWLPGWLDKILPHISVEGETMPGDEETPPGVAGDGPRHAAPGPETA